MAKRRVLKNVAHNVLASFTSYMNFAGKDYVMGYLVEYSRATGTKEFFIDFVSGDASPVLTRRPLSAIVPHYMKMFWNNVDSQGSSRDHVHEAVLKLKVDGKISRPLPGRPKVLESPFFGELKVTDDEGVERVENVEGWWYPEVTLSPFRKILLKARSRRAV